MWQFLLCWVAAGPPKTLEGRNGNKQFSPRLFKSNIESRISNHRHSTLALTNKNGLITLYIYEDACVPERRLKAAGVHNHYH